MKIGPIKKPAFLKTGTKLGTANGGHPLANRYQQVLSSSRRQLGIANAGIVRSKATLTP